MPNWKKVIVSGSDAILNDVTLGTLTVSNMPAGTDNSVVVRNSSGQLVTDEIDSRVWGSSLIDGTGASNRITYYDDSNTITSNANFTFVNNNLGIGTSNPLYTAHFKSGSDAQLLIETDAPYDEGLGHIAGIKFKVEDTDGDDRIKGGLFFENTEDGLDYGRGRLLLATQRSGSNENVSINDWRLKVEEDGDIHIKQDLIAVGSIYTSQSATIGTSLQLGANSKSDSFQFNVSQNSSGHVILDLDATDYPGAVVDYVVRNSSDDVQRTGTIMVSAFNTGLAEGVTHTETTTPDLGGTTDHIRFTTSISTEGAWRLTVNNDASLGTYTVMGLIKLIKAIN